MLHILIYCLNAWKLDVFSCEGVLSCLSCLQLRRQVKLAVGLAEKRASQTLKSAVCVVCNWWQPMATDGWFLRIRDRLEPGQGWTESELTAVAKSWRRQRSNSADKGCHVEYVYENMGNVFFRKPQKCFARRFWNEIIEYKWVHVFLKFGFFCRGQKWSTRHLDKRRVLGAFHRGDRLRLHQPGRMVRVSGVSLSFLQPQRSGMASSGLQVLSFLHICPWLVECASKCEQLHWAKLSNELQMIRWSDDEMIHDMPGIFSTSMSPNWDVFPRVLTILMYTLCWL